MSSNSVIERMYPEFSVGGFTRVDSTVHFYQRINSVVSPDNTVLDIGAGRGNYHVDGKNSYKQRMMNFRHRCAKVIGIDVDDAVVGNPSLDEAFVIENNAFPVASSSVDVAFADWVLEHIDDVGAFSREVSRVMKPGGWFCARTPNKWGYISAASRLIPESFHKKVLRKAQPGRKSEDVFPTHYKMNTRQEIAAAFPEADWELVIYTHDAEPAYFGNNILLWRIARLIFWLTPPPMRSVIFVFARKRTV